MENDDEKSVSRFSFELWRNKYGWVQIANLNCNIKKHNVDLQFMQDILSMVKPLMSGHRKAVEGDVGFKIAPTPIMEKLRAAGIA